MQHVLEGLIEVQYSKKSRLNKNNMLQVTFSNEGKTNDNKNELLDEETSR